MLIILDVKVNKMGKLLIKIGMWMQAVWCKFQCAWNLSVAKLLFKVANCPNKLCTCK